MKIKIIASISVLTGLLGCSAVTNTEIQLQKVSAMEPTIKRDDKIEIDKSAYKSLIPERLDIVLFSLTEALKQESYTDPFLRRIIALPAEKVEIIQGKLYIDGKPLTEDYIAQSRISRTTLYSCKDSEKAYLKQPQTIPPDSYLVMGDNRGFSYDGHCWGVVPKSNIIGKVIKIIKNF